MNDPAIPTSTDTDQDQRMDSARMLWRAAIACGDFKKARKWLAIAAALRARQEKKEPTCQPN